MKIQNGEARIVLGKLLGLEEKTVVAFEISRAIKRLQEINTKLEERKLEIMSQYLVRDSEGNYTLTKDTVEALEKAKREGIEAVPTVFSYEVEEGREKEFREEISKLLEEVVDLNLKGVDCLNRRAKNTEGKSVPLVETLSDYFGSGEINFLEEIGVLTNLG